MEIENNKITFQKNKNSDDLPFSTLWILQIICVDLLILFYCKCTRQTKQNKDTKVNNINFKKLNAKFRVRLVFKWECSEIQAETKTQNLTINA